MEPEPTLVEEVRPPLESVAKPTGAMLPEPESIHAQAQSMSAQACFEHANLLWQGGGGFPVDRGEAALWFEQAAIKGLPAAMFAFAECLRWGDGILRNPKRAEIMYRLAAEAGDSQAIHWLAHAYAVGDGVERNLAEAARWRNPSPGSRSYPRSVWGIFGFLVGVTLASLAVWWRSFR